MFKFIGKHLSLSLISTFCIFTAVSAVTLTKEGEYGMRENTLSPKALVAALDSQNLSEKSSEKGLIIAVLDTQKILENSTVWKDLTDQLQSKKLKIQDDYTDRLKKVESEAYSLKQKEGILKKENFNGQMEALEQKMHDIKREGDEEMAKLRQEHLSKMQTINNKILSIVDQVLTDKNLDMVLVKDVILASKKNITRDITDNVLSILNKDLPKLGS